MKTIHFFLLIWLFIGFTQCQKPGCAEHSGPITSLKRPIAPFTKILLQGNINLIITHEEEGAVLVEAGENLQPNISTIVENEVLIISNNSTCEWLKMPDKKINVFVSAKQLKQINYEGSGRVTCLNTIEADSFTLYSKKGAGDINLNLKANYTTIQLEGENPDVNIKGKSSFCTISIDPRSTIDLSSFEVRSMEIQYMGIRDAVINVTEQLTAKLYHSGNIYYKGTPFITPEYYSSGRLIRSL